MKGVKLLSIAVMVMAAASCGTLRNKQKQSSSLKIIEGAKVEQTLTESTGRKAEIKEKEVDKGAVVTERERLPRQLVRLARSGLPSKRRI